MANPYRKHKMSCVLCLLILLGLTACVPATATVVPVASLSPALPQVTFIQAPDLVCQSATQVRLAPRITGVWPGQASATWQLTASGNSDILGQGTFSPDAEHLFAAFPEGQPLPPGEYALALYLQDMHLAEHTFSVSSDAPVIQDFALALTPVGPKVSTLANGTHHFYLRITYKGACPGAPLWVSVQRGEKAICVSNTTVSKAAGTQTIPCYQTEGGPLTTGLYQAEASLMGQADAQRDFEVGAPPPSPTPTSLPTLTPTSTPVPTPRPLKCAPLFAAAGLQPEGQPFLSQEIFDWYSQSIYVGSQCQAVSAGTPWTSAWYRNGQVVREAHGTWTDTQPEGTVWDSITGVPEAPFLLPGTYTVTMTLGETTSLTTSFRILYYPQPTPTTP